VSVAWLTASRVARRLSGALGLVLPLLAVPALAARGADLLGDRVALGLVTALAPLSAWLPAPDSEPSVLTETELASYAPATRVARGPTQMVRATKRGSKPGAAHAIYISSAQVLALASRRALPNAVPVPASPEHPAGLQLRGVSALGVGLQDGDVLTEAGGQRASSVAAVVGIVLAARARHSPEISGHFFRGNVPYVVRVEQPYPPGT
jgi:hypothetical protein